VVRSPATTAYTYLLTFENLCASIRNRDNSAQRVVTREGSTTCWDRALWAFVLRRWNGWKDRLVLVKPQTVIAWHRRAFRLHHPLRLRQALQERPVESLPEAWCHNVLESHLDSGRQGPRRQLRVDAPDEPLQSRHLGSHFIAHGGAGHPRARGTLPLALTLSRATHRARQAFYWQAEMVHILGMLFLERLSGRFEEEVASLSAT